MKFYSDVTKKFYDNEAECIKAEKKQQELLAEQEAAAKKKSEERTKRAKEVEGAYKAVLEAQSAYEELLKKFVADYGSFHMTINDASKPVSAWTLFDRLFDLF